MSRPAGCLFDTIDEVYWWSRTRRYRHPEPLNSPTWPRQGRGRMRVYATCSTPQARAQDRVDPRHPRRARRWRARGSTETASTRSTHSHPAQMLSTDRASTRLDTLDVARSRRPSTTSTPLPNGIAPVEVDMVVSRRSRAGLAQVSRRSRAGLARWPCS